MRFVGLLALCILTAVAACDGHSPNEPDFMARADFARVNTPSSLTATAVSPTEIDLSWPKGGNQVDGFQLFRSTTGQAGTFTQLASVGSTTTAYGDVALTASTTYCYELRSYRVTGRTTTYSDFSAVACATTPAPPPPPVAAPSDVNAVPLHDEYYLDVYNAYLAISWVDHSTNEDGFRVEQAATPAGPWTLAVTTGANATVATWFSSREKQVCFRVIAYNTAGASNPSPAHCTTPPANVTGLVAVVPADQSSIQLTWSDNSAVEDGYRVSRRDAAGAQAWTDIATLAPNSTTYSDATAVVDVGYTYRVLAMKDGGYSDDSNLATASIASTAPAAPSNFVAGFDADYMYGWVYFGASWTDNSPNDIGFRVQSSVDGVSGWTFGTIVDAATPYLQQQLDIFSSAGVGGCWRVVAFNSRGDSPASNVSCSEWAAPATNFIATPIDDHSIDLSWTDNAHYEKSYLVLRSTDQFGTYDVIAELPPNSTSFHDTGLTSGTAYWYLVVNNYDYQPYDQDNYSDYATAMTFPTPAATTSARITVKGRPSTIRVRGLPGRKLPPITQRRRP